MFNDLPYEDEDDGLDLFEEIEILGEAYENAYMILTGKVHVEEFLLQEQNLEGCLPAVRSQRARHSKTDNR